jgi:hypothetical protein
MLWHLKILFKLIKYLIEYLNWEHEPKVHIYNTLSWLNVFLNSICVQIRIKFVRMWTLEHYNVI